MKIIREPNHLFDPEGWTESLIRSRMGWNLYSVTPYLDQINNSVLIVLEKKNQSFFHDKISFSISKKKKINLLFVEFRSSEVTQSLGFKWEPSDSTSVIIYPKWSTHIPRNEFKSRNNLEWRIRIGRSRSKTQRLDYFRGSRPLFVPAVKKIPHLTRPAVHSTHPYIYRYPHKTNTNSAYICICISSSYLPLSSK